MRDILARLLPERASNAEELEEMRRAAWQSQGVIAVRPHEIRDDWLRQALINLAEARYGRRQSRGRTTDMKNDAPKSKSNIGDTTRNGDIDEEGSR